MSFSRTFSILLKCVLWYYMMFHACQILHDFTWLCMISYVLLRSLWALPHQTAPTNQPLACLWMDLSPCCKQQDSRPVDFPWCFEQHDHTSADLLPGEWTDGWMEGRMNEGMVKWAGWRTGGGVLKGQTEGIVGVLRMVAISSRRPTSVGSRLSRSQILRICRFFFHFMTCI